jgi:hypothetical protein
MRGSFLALSLVLGVLGLVGCKDEPNSANNDLSMNDTDGMVVEEFDLAGVDLTGVDLAGQMLPGCPTACTEGAKSCDGNGVRSCVKAGTCTEWSAPVPCGGGGVCSGGLCVGTCKNQCQQGATYCSQNGFRTCAVGLGGCTDWSSTVTPCQNGAVCSGGVCADKCVDRCSLGQSICAGFGTQKCERKFSGCLDWSDPTPCDTGKVCSGGQCVMTCSDQCTAGDKKCDGTDGITTCSAQPASGCTDFSLPQLCGSGVCSANACQTCTDGTKRCSAQGNVEQCTSGVFAQIASCAFGCNMGSCTATVTCTPGQAQCNGNSVQICNSTGTAFLFAQTCSASCASGLCQGGSCTPNSKRCNGNDVETCDGAGTTFAKTATCTMGCDALSATCIQAGTTISGSVTMEGVNVFAGAVTIDASAIVQSNTGDLTIRADSIVVNGQIKVAPTGTTALGAPGVATSGSCGGAGGAYVNSTSNCGAFGQPWGSHFEGTIAAGSPGGADASAHPGGKGGGVLRLLATNSITLNDGSVLNADGAPGSAGSSTTICGSNTVGGGGGSGGGILVAGDAVTVTAGAKLSVKGGQPNGATSACTNSAGGSIGRIKVLYGSTGNIVVNPDNFTPGSFNPSLGQAADRSLIPPLTITSPTHSDTSLVYSDGAPSLGFTWNHPFGGVMGFYTLLNGNETNVSTQVTALPNSSNAGDLVRTDATSFDPALLRQGDNFFHITSVTSTSKIGEVEGNFKVQINKTPPVVTSSSHTMGTFVNKHDVSFDWSGLPVDQKNFSGIYYLVDHFGNTIPNTSGTFLAVGQQQSIILNLADGVWAFHAVFADTRGYLTKAASTFVVRIGADPGVNSISGDVVQAGGVTPISGAKIFVNWGLFKPFPTTTFESTASTTDGSWTVGNIPVGTWEVEVTAPGFQTTTQAVTVMSGTPTTGVHIAMTPTP